MIINYPIKMELTSTIFSIKDRYDCRVAILKEDIKREDLHKLIGQTIGGYRVEAVESRPLINLKEGTPISLAYHKGYLT